MKKLKSLFSENKWLLPFIRFCYYSSLASAISFCVYCTPDLRAAADLMASDSNLCVVGFSSAFIVILLIAACIALLDIVFSFFRKKS